MMNRALLIVLLCWACERESPPVPTAPVAKASVEKKRSRPTPRVVRSSPPSAHVRAPRGELRLSELSLRKGRVLWGKLGQKLARRVVVVLSSKRAPLAPRPAVAYANVAALIDSRVSVPTTHHRLPLATLITACENSRTKRHIANQARVMADGKVEVALARLGDVEGRIDLSDGTSGRVGGWETALNGREVPPETERDLLARYQSILSLDYLLANQQRREVSFEKDRGLLLAGTDNHVF